ncbi:hypothetical protein U1Q18_007938 [Sarracenia purpurea var. burkii]
MNHSICVFFFFSTWQLKHRGRIGTVIHVRGGEGGVIGSSLVEELHGIKFGANDREVPVVVLSDGKFEAVGEKNGGEAEGDFEQRGDTGIGEREPGRCGRLSGSCR